MTKGLFVCFLLVGQLALAQRDSVSSLPCANRTFTILIHEFVDTTLVPFHTITSLQSQIMALNNAFAPICVSFSICRKQDINNYNFLQWDRDSMDAEAMGLYSELRVIDVFLVDAIVNPSGAAGYATLGGISQDTSKLVLRKDAGGGVWIHEFGHFFGLEHPFETSHGIELANGSNCATAGDLICDTPADPYPQGATTNSNCEFVFSGRDPNNQYYLPDVENYMSYYDCACRFTPQQYVRMYNTYLIAPKTHW
jgi:hypothetical protein